MAIPGSCSWLSTSERLTAGSHTGNSFSALSGSISEVWVHSILDPDIRPTIQPVTRYNLWVLELPET